MNQQLRQLPIEMQIEKLTIDLVNINSINGTAGEGEIIDFVYDQMQTFPYYQKNPSLLWTTRVKNDPIGRKNLFAFVQSPKKQKKTIIYHSHLDTVDIEDYGNLKEYAFSAKQLEAFFKTYEGNADVQNDALSGDWMFGRGAVDMKSGAAVHIANTLYFSNHLEELEGNLLLILNGGEESEHDGIIDALDELNRLKIEEKLDFLMAINTDFTTPLYGNDPHRYIYTGVAGKLLPSFHIYGREVHVGDTLSGIDPNYIAAKITERIHNNFELTEQIEGETILPPTCLYQRDTKETYTVQTASTSHIYFNYFLYKETPNQVIDKLKAIAQQASLEAEKYLQKQYERYVEFSKVPKHHLAWNIEVVTYHEFISYLNERGVNTDFIIKEALEKNVGKESRQQSFAIVNALQKADPEHRPRVILFFAPPFLPHNYLKDNKEQDRILKQTITEVVAEVANETGEQFKVKRFFPYLADGSFLSIHATEKELYELLDNFPEWEALYPVPFEKIKALNIPSVTMGVYGKDGHKWTERVYKPYSFGILPGLIRKTTRELFKVHRH
ncbi:M20/M25/M40 family metallo-hydrolase [Lysinibacillus agricola]|uniref:M20/M25/M40 family metallo-hydrolase n=1 Tax=Lysinibacillus agricola TaxID=2590012 RepID=A0ABX7AT25_9BACI|nr:M20/M25/M40 family metallo-hydrolase [Lysinibacillus agricola]QQP12806.1 M20/M25/M40 family metallo-hydrolase [Lysinibacillus agricola]